jgi:hypothetical protein
MAVMVPDALETVFQSSAERRLFNRFRTQLSDEWYVLHSLDITRHPTKVIGETDFVLVGPLGVFFIEVKGGRVSCEEGAWLFVDRHGRESRKKESPWRQAASGLVQVRKEIEDTRGMEALNFGYGVIFPDEVFTVHGPEIEHAVLWDNRDWTLPIGEFVAKLDRHWSVQNRKSYGREPKKPDKAVARDIRKLLRPDVRTTFTLSSELNCIESEQVELTDEQSRTVRGMSRNRRSMVFGGAGTGKTLLAVDEAKRCAEEGQRILLLCYNSLLGQHLAENNEKVGIVAGSVHGYFSNVIAAAPDINARLQAARRAGDDEDLFRRVYSDLFMDAMVSGEYDPFDVLILDEAQDLMSESFMAAFDLALKGGMSNGFWRLFLDANQNIYGMEFEQTLNELLGYGVGQYELSINCRNSRKVAVNASVLSQIDVPLYKAVEGGFERFIYFEDRKDLAKKLNALVSELLSNGVSRSDMVFLSPKRLANSEIAELPLEFAPHDLTSSVRRLKNSIDYCTMQAFKGLERRIVIAVDLECIQARDKHLLLYCGLTRAKAGLVCCLNRRFRETHDFLTSEFGKRLPAILASY